LLDLAILRSAGQPGHDDWVVWVGAFSAAETALVIEQGITIGGKPLKDHLACADHDRKIAVIAWYRQSIWNMKIKPTILSTISTIERNPAADLLRIANSNDAMQVLIVAMPGLPHDAD
jgi:hypothetical protein